MPSSIYDDHLARPDLFHWFGIAEPDFDRWLRALPFRVHPSLVSFWHRTGGGDIFESETLLGPLATDESDNVLSVNEFHWGLGMPRDFVLFHVGFVYSASHVDWHGHETQLLTLKRDSYEIENRFDTFSEWYTQTLRSEYWERYGLSSQ